MKKKLAFVIATWFGLGFSPIAPGTVGTLAALPLYYALRGFGAAGILAAAAVLSLAGIWAAGVVAEVAADEDPQIVVVERVPEKRLLASTACRDRSERLQLALEQPAAHVDDPGRARQASRSQHGITVCGRHQG